jgi:hypothetical protein
MWDILNNFDKSGSFCLEIWGFCKDNEAFVKITRLLKVIFKEIKAFSRIAKLFCNHTVAFTKPIATEAFWP